MDNLKKAVQTIGKPQWRDMLLYVAELHEKCTHPPRPPFPFPWEEIGTGYCYGPAFGHWDIVHAILDVMAFEPEHAKNQILNNLAAQQEDGLVPGVIWMRKKKPDWSTTVGHPPVWPIAVQDYAQQTGSDELINHCYEPLIRQIGWFESNRKATPVGFYYTDILNHKWESGVDEGIRFHKVRTGPFACVDATSHVYLLYDCAAQWSERVGKSSGEYKEKAHELQEFIQNKLFDDETGFFHDVWSVGDPSKRCMALEGMWPVVVGAATREQADRVMDENLQNHKRFFSEHPVSTVGIEDPLFELRMWRGPTWNSMTYWAARGCMRYSRPHAARSILEEALDASARQFQRTGTIWEFYHPHGGEPEELQRKPLTRQNQPCRDYLGHNPLIAMALMYEDAMFISMRRNIMSGSWKVSPSHTALRVKNIKECIKFYNEVLGLPINRLVGEPDDPRVCFLPGLELIKDDSIKREECRGLVHIGLKVENPEAAIADLKAKGVKFREKERLMPAFFEDPDGNVVEFV